MSEPSLPQRAMRALLSRSAALTSPLTMLLGPLGSPTERCITISPCVRISLRRCFGMRPMSCACRGSNREPAPNCKVTRAIQAVPPTKTLSCSVTM